MSPVRPVLALLAGAGLLLATGCATAPAELCDHGEFGLTVLPTPPPESTALLAEIAADFPNAVDADRDHVVWLQSGDGDLFLCTYQRRPVLTGRCGADVHHYARTGDGYEGVDISISACH